ncbi:processed acidic surface protein [Peribacillus sp. SCS-37]|uniref:processed acidic surface protein n=1 Tax=Paraperibacillus esterisolvens TaxID=3115296 RepID=UPI0039067430
MKKLGAILLSLSLLLAFFPGITHAAQSPQFNSDLKTYLEKVSMIRGKEVTKADLERALAAYETTLADFDKVSELNFFMGRVIKKDLSNLDGIYEEYELDAVSLEKLMQSYGEELSDYIYVDDLYDAVSSYLDEPDSEEEEEDGEVVQDPTFEEDLQNYLEEISATRGIPVTKTFIENYLAGWEDELAYYKNVEEVRETLGDVIQKDFRNLDYFQENYGLTQAELFALLEENGKKIDDYIFIDQLEEDVWSFTEGGDSDEEVAEDMMPIFEDELGLTQAELTRIEDHLNSIESKLADPAILERMEALGDRMAGFDDFETMDELQPADIAEMIAIYDEFLAIFDLKAAYFLVKDGQDHPITIADLLKLDELKGANLKIMLYNSKGDFLADLIITGEMVDSDVIQDKGNQIKETVKEVKQTAAAPKKEKPAHLIKTAKKPESSLKTVNGAKLPKTASSYIPNAAIGLIVILSGLFLFRKMRKA